MTDQTPTTQHAPAKTIIRPNIKNYVRAKSGAGKRTHRIDDFTARSLDGKTVEQVLKGGAKLGVDVAKWSHLNPGQQRMLVGNAIRNLLNSKKDPIEEEAVTAVFGEPAVPYDAEAVAAAKAAAEEQRAAKKAAKEAEKAAKAAAKEAADWVGVLTLAGPVDGTPGEASGSAEPPQGKGRDAATHTAGGKSRAGNKK